MIRAFILGLLVLSPVAVATTVLRADVPSLTLHSDDIVRGRVIQTVALRRFRLPHAVPFAQ